jgi:acyl carrier protein
VTADELAGEVRDFLRQNFILDAARPLGLDDSLLENRIIDSTGFLELVMFLEERYSLRIDEAEMVPDNLETIGSIAAFVLRKRAAA